MRYTICFTLLLLCSISCTNLADTPPAEPQANLPTPTPQPPYRFSGQLSRGESFTHKLPNGLYFKLIPDAYGWIISITPSAEDGANFAGAVTRPYRGPNALFIEGWHFRNSDNTAVNDGTVNAPQEQRGFFYLTNDADYQIAHIALACIINALCDEIIDALPRPPNEQETRRLASDVAFEMHQSIPTATGRLIMTDLQLGNLTKDEYAWIERMSFDVAINLVSLSP